MKVNLEKFGFRLGQVTSLTLSTLLISQSNAFAGGGSENPTQTTITTPTEQTNTVPQQSPQPPQNPITQTTTVPAPITTPPNGSTIINSPYSGNYNNTNQSNCGLSISVGANNTAFGTPEKVGFDGRIVFNTNPCPNQEKLIQLQQSAETKRQIIRSQQSIIENCITARRDVLIHNSKTTPKDLDRICTLPPSIDSIAIPNVVQP